MIYSFKNDYSEVCHKKVLEKINEISNKQFTGYGLDTLTKETIELIKKTLDFQNCDIHFLAGGTQTNMLAISTFLKRYEACIAVNSGHINVHETGAIEGCGNKILIADGQNGKITVEGIRKVCNSHLDEHMVKPKLVYISNSTEIGTIYSKSELQAISMVCKELDLYLFLDGARIGSAIESKYNDLTLNDICNLVDAFYIGGTKNGACLGEALIIINDNFKKDLRYHIKHKGALLSKGFFVAANFNALFIDGLFFEIAKKQNELAYYLYEELDNLGFDFLTEVVTNQVFVIMENDLIENIKNDYLFETWEEFDSNSTVIRLVTSFNTSLDNVKEFIEYIKNRI